MIKKGKGKGTWNKGQLKERKKEEKNEKRKRRKKKGQIKQREIKH